MRNKNCHNSMRLRLPSPMLLKKISNYIIGYRLMCELKHVKEHVRVHNLELRVCYLSQQIAKSYIICTSIEDNVDNPIYQTKVDSISIL